MGLFDVTPSLAPYASYGGQTRKTLQEQIKLAPALYQANEVYQPLYNSLNLQNLEQFLLGSPSQTYDTYAWSPARYSDGSGGGGGGGFMEFLDLPGSPTSIASGNPFGGIGSVLGFGGDDDEREMIRRGRWQRSGSATRGAQRGFLDIYETDIIPSLLRSQTAERSADISDVLNLGPEAREALRAANPDAAALLDELFSQAQGDLGAGASLNPSERRNLEQQVRGGQADRGMGFSPLDTFEEALASLNYGRGLQNERRAFAGGVLNDLEGFYGDPFQAILGRSSGTSAAPGIGGLGAQASRMGSLFNPESAYASNVYDTQMNQQQSVNNAEASNNAAILGSIISAVGNIGGMAAGGAI